ncbi:MAG: sigma 54-interacting transcriptional regulator [Planctomycetota bacterium]
MPNELDELPVGMIHLDASGRIITINALAGERLGVEPGRVDRVPLSSLFDPPPVGLSEPPSERLAERNVRPASAGLPPVDLLIAPRSGGGSIVVLIDRGERDALQAEIDRLNAALASVERDRARMTELQRELGGQAEAPTIIGGSPAVRQMFDHAERVAASPATVLILGESGSGKELVARTIHARSNRAGGPLVSVNCAALPETLLESELFGHERGAFTGADRQRLGKFELADTGTLFLDEVGELSPAAQAKLLRVLQEGAFERVGGAETIRVDVRVVAATHRDLASLVGRNRFREDLFYRLNVVRIDVPPLRDRREDIRPLAEFLHERHARRMARVVLPISDRSMRRLMSYRWPGNVRELENAIERATVLASGEELEIELPDDPAPERAAEAERARSGAAEAAPRDVLLDLTADQLQRLQIMHALETSGYRVFGDRGAAKKLAINPQTLLSRMDKLGIPRPREMRHRLRDV